MATNFVAHVIVIALPQYGKPASEKVFCLREKTRHSSSCRGSIIVFNTEMTQMVESGIRIRKCCVNVISNYEKGATSDRAY